MTSVYPGALDAFATNKSKGDLVRSSDRNDLADAINKIEAKLGIGDDVTVAGSLLVRGGSPWVALDASGAIGDGVVDDTAALIDATTRVPTGGEIRLGPGKSYKLTSAEVLPVLAGKALSIQGAGKDSSRVIYTGAGYFSQFGDAGAIASAHQYMRDFTLDASGSSLPDGLVKFKGTNFCGLERLRLLGPTGGDKILVYFDPGDGSLRNYFNVIDRCELYGQVQASDILVKLHSTTGNGANSNWMSRNWMGIAHYAYLIDGGDTNVIQTHEFNGSIDTAVRIQGTAGNNKIAFDQFDGPTNPVDLAAGVTDTILAFLSGGGTILNAGTRTQLTDIGSGITIDNTGAVSPLVVDATRGIVMPIDVPLDTGGKITIPGRQTADPSTSSSFIQGSSSGGAGYPYTEVGNLIIGSRQSGAARDVLFYSGNPAVERLRVDRLGLVTAAKDLRATEGLVTKHLSGAGKVTVSDSDFSASGTPIDGAIAVVRNTTDSTVRIGIRSGGAWKVVQVL